VKLVGLSSGASPRRASGQKELIISSQEVIAQHMSSYYPEFVLPSWFNGPNGLRQLLETLWRQRYDGVDDDYEEEATQPILSAYEAIRDILWGQDESLRHQRYIYLGYALALACEPTVAEYAPHDPMPRIVLNAVGVRLRGASQGVRRDWTTVFPPRGARTGSQDLDAGRLVFWNLLRILGWVNDRPPAFWATWLRSQEENVGDFSNPQEARAALIDMLSLCVEDFAIVPSEHRDVLNWILIQVVPAAWCRRLPDVVYPATPL